MEQEDSSGGDEDKRNKNLVEKVKEVLRETRSKVKIGEEERKSF